MAMAIELAAQGGNAVRPNPLVGAVIVKDGKVVARGYHTRYGAPHAEREALADAGESASGATMYVTLEPCNHFGKTPPCTDGIIEAGIREVVIGMPDPNPGVAGQGMQRLQETGIECRTGILEDECRVQNEVFLVNIMQKRPFVQLKIAQTLDGFIAPEDGYSKWITGEPARKLAHTLRSEADAVMVGSGTLRQDNPALTVRHIQGPQPRRVLLTDTLDLPIEAEMFSDEFKNGTVILYTEAATRAKELLKSFAQNGIAAYPVKADSYGKADMGHVMQVLWENNIYKLMVEGGAGLYSSFLEAGMVDRIDAFIAPTVFGSGISVFQYIQARSVLNGIHLDVSGLRKIGNDMYAILRRGC